MTTDDRPRRKKPRFAAAVPALLHHKGQDYPCLAEDLSRGGLSLTGELPWPSSETVELTLGDENSNLHQRLQARVAHVGEGDEGSKTRLGLDLSQLDEESFAKLDALVSRTIEGMEPAAIASLDESASPAEVKEALEKTPLPHRIALAVRARKRERDFLRLDSSPQVIENLVRNPGLNPSEAKAIVRLPRLTPRAVETLATDPRWEKEEEIRIVLATHPGVTLPVAEKLVAKMGVPALRKVVQRPGLNPVLKQKLLARLSTKTLQGW